MATTPRVHLYFAPIKKDRLGFLIEKSVELGVTDLHPVITERTQNRKANPDKIQKQIIEAAEQCERIDIPRIHPVISFRDLPDTPIYCAQEREGAALFNPAPSDEISILIGPEGGWSADEVKTLSSSANISAVSLGSRILRAETAAMFMLSRL